MKWYFLFLTCLAKFLVAQETFVPLNLNLETQTVTGLDAFIENCKTKQLVYTGENHTYLEFNNAITIGILKELNLKAGFNNFLIELGPARSYWINKYLQNDSVAEVILKASSSPNYFKIYTYLKSWNNTLPINRKITVYGIDAERFYNIPYFTIGYLFNKHKLSISNPAASFIYDWMVNANKELTVSSIDFLNTDSASEYNYTYSKYVAFDLISQADSLQTYIKNHCASDSNLYIEMLGYLKEHRKFNQYENSQLEHNWRETIMFNRLALLLTDSSKKYYGQFGRCHTINNVTETVCNWHVFKSTLMRVKQNLPNVKMANMGIYYKFENQISSKPIKSFLNSNIPLSFIQTDSFSPKQLLNDFDYIMVNNKFINIKSKYIYNKNIRANKIHYFLSLDILSPLRISDFTPEFTKTKLNISQKGFYGFSLMSLFKKIYFTQLTFDFAKATRKESMNEYTLFLNRIGVLAGLNVYNKPKISIGLSAGALAIQYTLNNEIATLNPNSPMYKVRLIAQGIQPLVSIFFNYKLKNCGLIFQTTAFNLPIYKYNKTLNWKTTSFLNSRDYDNNKTTFTNKFPMQFGLKFYAKIY